MLKRWLPYKPALRQSKPLTQPCRNRLAKGLMVTVYTCNMFTFLKLQLLESETGCVAKEKAMVDLSHSIEEKEVS